MELPAGISLHTLETIISSIGFKQGRLLVRYLGVPLVTKKLTEKDCQALIDNIKNMLHQWSRKKMSYAGRVELIKTVYSFYLEFSAPSVQFEHAFHLLVQSVGVSSKFMEGFFPAMRVSELRRSILGIIQKDGESLYDYWEIFKKLCASCPQHVLIEKTLLQYFYEGLTPLKMKMIDVTSE
ncbi:uncharacterized protein LOC120180960 [Hibiscus syriacus]|uniref:uncharacterized protein LOC120180960 n=1 Tax=Hibiscus syriacus TaxID=106335 RepID=UPI0019217C32|nr:uncharacterized protein LOC120180960 [Hibiscus syriacus]